jgi:hypothetical protein
MISVVGILATGHTTALLVALLSGWGVLLLIRCAIVLWAKKDNYPSLLYFSKNENIELLVRFQLQCTLD